MIKIKDLKVSLGGRPILDKVNLSIPAGQCLALMGPSGLGKSTLLKTLVGEYFPTSGTISGLETVGYCQQNAPLFPWLSVVDNLELASSQPRSEIEKLLAQVGLAGIEEMKPHTISSGMRRRVTVLRAFLNKGSTVLLDEPFTGLDIVTRDQLIELVTALWQRMEKTLVYVTHDIDEAIRIADRIAVFGPYGQEFTLDIVNPLPRPRQISTMDPASLLTYRNLWVEIEHAIKSSHLKTSHAKSQSP